MGGIRIKNDLFDIARRVKAIDSDYFIEYNTTADRYEVHCERCKPSLQLVVPYSALDKRTVDHVLRTRIANAITELAQIDAYNEAIDAKRIAKTVDEAAYKMKGVTEFVRKGGVNLPNYNEL